MDGQFYASAFKDFKDMGCDGAAVEVLREGLAALPSCPELLELARREGVSLPEAPGPAAPAAIPAAAAAAVPIAAPAAPGAAPAPAAPVVDWRPPPPPRPNMERVRANPAVRKIVDAQDAVAAFVEADAAAWAPLRERAAGRGEELLAEEARLRSLAIRALGEGMDDLRRLNVEARPELLRSPCTPDLPSALQNAWSRGGPEAALREVVAKAAPGAAFQDGLWDSEGPGAQLDLARRMSACEAPIARAREIARTGAGTVHSLLVALAEEAEAAVRSLPVDTAQVLVIGGHGASAVRAARAGAKRVVVWEGQSFVASVAREVLQRNLGAEEAHRCSVEEGAEAPAGAWDVVVVELWHGAGALAWGPLEALRRARASAGGALGRVIPAKLCVEVALADGRLTSASGFDLSRLDARFRGLSAAPLRVELDGAGAHPTSLRPALVTDAAAAFELDLQGELAAEAGPVALQLRGVCSGIASMAVVSLSFTVGHGSGHESSKAVVLRFGQWLPGGYSVAEGKEVRGLSARRGPGRIWVDWDWGGAAEPPLGYMALSEWYYEMLRDEARHEAYDRAIRAEVRAVKARAGSCRVLDVGSGDGILSMMSLRAGATAAAGVEVVTAIARLSEEIVAANRPSASRPDAPLPAAESAPLDIWCTDVRGVSRPPEALKFDVLVSELMDASGLGENLILLTRGARERLCREGAPVIPCRLRLLAVLCEVRLPTLAGVSLDAFWPFWPSERMDEGLWIGVDLDKRDGDFRILTQPTELLSLELGVADVDDVPRRKEIDFPGTADGTANCVVWWFDAQLSREDPSAVLTNAPNCVDSRHAATCWGQAMAELSSVVEVRQGVASEVTMEVPFGDYQLTFRPRGSGGAPAAGSRAAQRKGPSAEPPPGAQPYGARFAEELEAYRKLRAEMDAFKRSRKIGQTAMRAADVGALNVLQRTALSFASQPLLFGVEPSVAAKMLAGWYSVGGEGRT